MVGQLVADLRIPAGSRGRLAGSDFGFGSAAGSRSCSMIRRISSTLAQGLFIGDGFSTSITGDLVLLPTLARSSADGIKTLMGWGVVRSGIMCELPAVLAEESEHILAAVLDRPVLSHEHWNEHAISVPACTRWKQ